jgi:sulfur carrier protein ThiS
VPAPDDAHCTFETFVTFGSNGDAARFQRSGFAPPDDTFTFTSGAAARLEFILPHRQQPVGIRMRLAGLVKGPELPAQPVIVSVNGKELAQWKVAEERNFFAIVPRELISDGGRIELQLDTPAATSPKTLGLSDDDRVLGVRCFELELSRAVLLRPLRQKT